METQILQKVDAITEQMLDGILTIVKIESIKTKPEKDAPFGRGCKDVLDKALEIAQNLGFQTKNIDNYAGYAQYGEGESYIGIIGHLDVVEAKEGWTHPPFSGFIDSSGRIYSRGILDNKGPIMSCLYALYAIKELGIKLAKPIRVIFGTDEESGFADLIYYLKKEKPPIMGWTPDCKYPVVYGERGRANLELSADKEQASVLYQFLNMYFLDANKNGDRLGIHVQDTTFGEMQMSKYALEERAEKIVFHISLSYPACVTIKEVMNTISKKLTKGLSIELVHNYDPVLFEKDCFMVKQLQSAYETVTGEDGTPVTTTGGTYAKVMPNIVPFGPSFPGQKGIAHNPNEWMDIKDIVTNAKIYALSMYKLAK